MGRFEITGQAVVFTPDGVKVLDCMVRRWASAISEYLRFHLSNADKKALGDNYILIGGARTVPTNDPWGQCAYAPAAVDAAKAYASSHFFRFMLLLMRLAQFEPIHNANPPFGFIIDHQNYKQALTDDNDLYQHYGFSPAMIAFAEEHYHDVLYHGEN